MTTPAKKLPNIIFKTAYDLLQEQEELTKQQTSVDIRKNTDRMHYIDDELKKE